MRKGYRSEYKAKKELIKEFGKRNVIKVAQWGIEDFLVLKKGKLEKIVEVKECHKEKYYPKPRERKQFEWIKKLAKEHKCKAEVWIYYPKKRKKVVIDLKSNQII